MSDTQRALSAIPTMAAAPAVSDRDAIALARELNDAMKGPAAGDAFTRGRYATDASIYQIMPAAVAFPSDAEDVAAVIDVAARHSVPVIARGAGTSQNGQPIGPGIVVDFSRHFNNVLSVDADARTARVEPGTVLQHLNTRLREHGLFFPV